MTKKLTKGLTEVNYNIIMDSALVQVTRFLDHLAACKLRIGRGAKNGERS
jgi:hypothetical protein